MVVFVCSPYRGDKQRNAQNAIAYCQIEMAMGNTPFAPHLFFTQLTDNDDDIEHGIDILQRCDEVHVYGNRITAGMKQEIDFAEYVGIPVRYMERGDPD